MNECDQYGLCDIAKVKFRELEKRYEDRFYSQKEAIAKAERASETRFQSVNEFRAALADQQSTFATRVELEAKIKSLIEKVDDLKSAASKSEGKGMGSRDLWAYIVGAMGLVLTTLTVMRMFGK